MTLDLTLSVKDTELFNELLSIMKRFMSDERLSKEVKEDYINCIDSLLDKYNENNNN